MTSAIVLLHGLARTHLSMRKLEAYLKEQGYTVLNLHYPSRKYPLEELARSLESELAELPDSLEELFLVTHSLGALVGRLVMAQNPSLPWSRAVFLAPPSGGSKVARTIESHPVFGSLYRLFYGPAGMEVMQTELELPVPLCSFGVIAGTVGKSLSNPTSWLSRHQILAEEESDGTLSVQETRLEGMDDFVSVEADHTTIMNHPPTFPLVLRFLQTGSFLEPDTA